MFRPSLFFFQSFLVLLYLAYGSLQTITCPPNLPNSTCGELKVPLDHANPSKTVNISILYAITFPSILEESHNALLLVHKLGIGILNQELGLTRPEFANQVKRPVVIFDPRGTGNASRLNCSLQGKALSLDLHPLYIRRCLSEIGEEVLHYSATAIAKDMEMLRTALGFDQWDLLGLSYGSLISQAYGVLYPDSVRSMLLDSPIPLCHKDLYWLRHHEAYARIHAEMNKHNPNFSPTKFKSQLGIVLRRLRSNKALRDEIKIDPRLFFHMYRLTQDSFADAVASAAVEKNYTGLIGISKKMEIPVLPLRNYSIAMAVSTACNSMVDMVPWDPDAGLLERLWSLGQDLLHKVRAQDFSPFSLTEGFKSVINHCPAIPFPQLRREGLPLHRGPQREIPALVLVGDLDPLTPLEDIIDLDPVLKKNVAVVKGAGHVATRSLCATRLFYEFVFDLTIRNLSLCG